MDTLLSCAPPRTWKITDLCTTTPSQRHWIYTLHWSDIHHFLLLLHPLTNKNDGGRIADWLPIWSNVSTFFSPPVCQLFISHSFQLCSGRLGIIEAVMQLYGQQSTDAQLSCPGTTKDQLPAPWHLKLFWETRIRADHEFTQEKS